MRLDLFLFEKNLCCSRTRAKALVTMGAVKVNGKVIDKASFEVPENAIVKISDVPLNSFVGRGALKLEHALEVFSVNVEDKICADIGASTGGFTQSLLNRGAKCVFAVDSGTNQLAEVLRQDTRVISLENTNARYLTQDMLGTQVDIIVMDVSFISQTVLYPAILNIAKLPCDIITLVKPQFETHSKSKLGKKGVIKDEKTQKQALNNVKECALLSGFKILGECDSPITGGSGNKEFLLHLRLE